MTEITTLFWDVGNVLLTDAWDKPARQRAAVKFKLKWDEFEERHELVFHAFEQGQLSLDHYLDQTVFYGPRRFTKPAFKEFMFAQSKPLPKSLALLERLAGQKKYLTAMLNNESLELNEYRIRQFKLGKYFSIFLSSCYLGVRKPDEAIYRLAMEITQRKPEESLLIDDRALNVESARRFKMQAIHFKNAAQLEKTLQSLGIV